MSLKSLFIESLLALILTLFILSHANGCEFLVNMESGQIIHVYDNGWKDSCGTGERNSLVMGILTCKDLSTQDGENLRQSGAYFHYDYFSELNLSNWQNTQRLSFSILGVQQSCFTD